MNSIKTEKIKRIHDTFMLLTRISKRWFVQRLQTYGLTLPQFVTLAALAAHRRPASMSHSPVFRSPLQGNPSIAALSRDRLAAYPHPVPPKLGAHPRNPAATGKLGAPRFFPPRVAEARLRIATQPAKGVANGPTAAPRSPVHGRQTVDPPVSHKVR